MKSLLILLLLVLAVPTWGADLTAEQCQKMLRIRYRIETIDNLEKRQLIGAATAKTERLAYLKKAGETLGKEVTYGQLKSLTKGFQVIPAGPARLDDVPRAISANKNIGFFVVLLVIATALWFSLKTLPLAPVVGFSATELFIRSLSVVFSLVLILGLLSLLRLYGTELTGCKELETEALNFLAYLYLGGVIILSSKWYRPQGRLRTNLFAIFSFFAALAISRYFQLGHLLKVAATFLGVYCLSKYFEIPWKKQAYVIAILGLCGIGYLIYQLRILYPSYFLF